MRMTDLEDDIFQAHCALENLQSWFQDGGRIQYTDSGVVIMALEDGSEATINLAPIKRLIAILDEMK